MARNKTYHPSPKANPIIISKKIEMLKSELQTHKNLLKSVVHSYNARMDHLANFAKHDIGNAIQNISAIIRVNKNVVPDEVAESLRASVDKLEATLSNLGELIHISPEKTFTLSELMRGTEIFVRHSLRDDRIEFNCLYDSANPAVISQPYQALQQLIHNLILNAQKALKEQDQPRLIEIESNIKDEWCVIKVKDTGKGISDDDLPKIFEFGFTTTSGSGIGLFHAKSVLSEMGGLIDVDRNIDNFSTIFTIKFPIYGNQENTCD